MIQIVAFKIIKLHNIYMHRQNYHLFFRLNVQYPHLGFKIFIMILTQETCIDFAYNMFIVNHG
jgi:hypothetical protein